MTEAQPNEPMPLVHGSAWFCMVSWLCMPSLASPWVRNGMDHGNEAEAEFRNDEKPSPRCALGAEGAPELKSGWIKMGLE